MPEAAAGRARRRPRVHLHPNRLLLFYAAIVAAILMAAVNHHNNLAFLVAFLLTVVALWAAADVQRCVRGIRLAAAEPPPVPAGSPLRLELDVAVPLPGACAAVDATVEDADGAVLGRSAPAAARGDHVSLTVTIAGLPRGRHRLERARILVHHPLGIIHASVVLPLATAVLVHPRPRRHAPADAGAAEAGGRPVSEDEFDGLRPYRPGDPLRRIDWKAAARRDALLVKSFTDAEAGEEDIAAAPLAHLDLERRLEHLAWRVERAAACDRRFSLDLGTWSAPRDRGEHHRRRCLAALACHPEPPP